METTVPTQIEEMLDLDSLLLASLILKDVNRTVRNIRMLMTVLLRYVAIGASIVKSLMGIVMPGVTEDY